MIYLVLAIISSTLVSILIRYSEENISSQMSMFMANYAVCALLGTFFIKSTQIHATTFIFALICGILSLAGFVFLKYNVKVNGIVLSSTFMKLGVLIPTIMAIVVFKETPKMSQYFGIVLSCIAIILIQFEKEASTNNNKKYLLVFLLVVCGCCDAMSNIFEQYGIASEKDVYLALTFVVAFLCAGLLKIKEANKASHKDVVIGALIGIPNYFSARFLLLALGSMDAILVYPMYSIITIVCVAISGVMLFHEQMSLKKYVSLVLILFAIFLLNI